MKKTVSFLRSMKFGMILLLIILVLCFLGSFVVQGREEAEYIARYGEQTGAFIQFMGLDHIFSTWYFILISLMFCANLVLCSIQRFKATLNWKKNFMHSAENKNVQYPLNEDKRALLVGYLEKKHRKKESRNGVDIYSWSIFGAWGSFVTHISLLLIFLVGAAVLIFPKVDDIKVPVGETAILADGSELYVYSFRMADENDSVDYVSNISLTLPNGKTSGLTEIKVNYPLRLGGYKIYQQSYYTGGSVTIRNDETGKSDFMFPTESCFLTLDGENGFFLESMYPGYVKGSDGKPVMTDSDDISAYVYTGAIVSRDDMESVTLFPGDEVQTGGMTLKFNAPPCPGLRVKQVSSALLLLLYLTFALLIVGLWMCFFKIPICLSIRENGFSVTSSRVPGELLLDLEVEGVIDEKHSDNK